MMRYVFACFVLFAFSCAGAKDRVPPEELEQWMTYYYVQPQLNKIGAALKALTAKGFFENDDVQAPLSGFFTEVFRANPGRIEGWVKPYIGIPNRHILYSALWMANSKQSRAAIEHMANSASSEEATRLRSLLSSDPPTVTAMSIDSPASLDYLWGCFMASGSEAPVLRIIDQMKLSKTKGNVNAILIGGAAQWSVSANARQHKKVLRIVKERVKTADAETKMLLEEILEDMETEKAKK